LQQVSLSGTKQRYRGGLLPLTLFIAAILHLAIFYIVDLRLNSTKPSSMPADMISVDVIKKRKSVVSIPVKAPPVKVVKQKPIPVKKVAVKPEPTAVAEVIPEPATEPVEEQPSEEVHIDSAIPDYSVVSVSHEEVVADLPSVENLAILKDVYREKVRNIISSNKKYPVKARRRDMQGSVTVAFNVESDGLISNGVVVVTSGFNLLDKSALQILAKSSPLPEPPEAMDFILPISFRLN